MLNRVYTRPEVEVILSASEGRSVTGLPRSEGHTFARHVKLSNEQLVDERMRAARDPSDPDWATSFVRHADAVTAALHLLSCPVGRQTLDRLDRRFGPSVQEWSATFPVDVQYRIAHGMQTTGAMTGQTNAAHIVVCNDGQGDLHIVTCYPLLPGGVTFRQINQSDYRQGC